MQCLISPDDDTMHDEKVSDVGHIDIFQSDGTVVRYGSLFKK